MEKKELMQKLYKGIIVSCQALEDEPLYGHEIMAKMAIAACQGGAVGIRANSAEDIRAIRQAIDLPIIGLKKIQYSDSAAYITPTIEDVKEVLDAGADIVAVDSTKDLKPGGITTWDFIRQIKEQYDTILMADISTYEEGIEAQEAGADIISTTLSGYTPYSRQLEGPDFELMERLSKDLKVPVIAEGRIWREEEAVKALELGVYAVVVGTAITRPKEITKRFTQAVASFR